MTQGRQASYTSKRQIPLELGKGGHVFLWLHFSWEFRKIFRINKLCSRYSDNFRYSGMLVQWFDSSTCTIMIERHDVLHVFS